MTPRFVAIWLVMGKSSNPPCHRRSAPSSESGGLKRRPSRYSFAAAATDLGFGRRRLDNGRPSKLCNDAVVPSQSGFPYRRYGLTSSTSLIIIAPFRPRGLPADAGLLGCADHRNFGIGQLQSYRTRVPDQARHQLRRLTFNRCRDCADSCIFSASLRRLSIIEVQGWVSVMWSVSAPARLLPVTFRDLAPA